MSETTPDSKATWRVIDTAVRVIAGLSLAAIIAVVGSLYSVKDRVTTIEASRFTNKDGATLLQVVADMKVANAKSFSDLRLEQAKNREATFAFFDTKLDLLQSSLNKVIKDMPREVPPAWLVERLQRAETTIEVLREKIQALNSELSVLQQAVKPK